MRNINELMGLMEGIDFDNVINDKEVSLIQSWVDRNRNLAHEKQQVELIEILEDVLEDHVITEDEKDRVLNFCSVLRNEVTDEIAKIYELNGIIEGIISDGVVNEPEIRRLESWMKDNSSIVRNYKPAKDLGRIIDDILEDDIVTDEEQEKILGFLKDMIKESQLSIKLDHLRKQVRERNNIGLDLIDLLRDEDAMDRIHDMAEKRLMDSLRSYAGIIEDKEIVFISLTLIAMLYYDGSYYEGVRDTYLTLYSRFPKHKVEGHIRSFLSRYLTKEEKSDKDVLTGAKNAIIKVVLTNALVPRLFLEPFIEFIFDIYRLNFNYDLPDNLYDEFDFVYDCLRSSMLSDDDDFQDNVTKKTYKLIRSTKKLISNGRDLNSLIGLSTIVVRLIDRIFWDKDFTIYNPYLKYGFDKWNATLKRDEYNNVSRGSKGERSRWEPAFYLDDKNIYLFPPIHRVKGSYDYRDIRIEVLSGGEVVYEKCDPDISLAVGGYTVNGENIRIEDPLNHLSYRLMAGEEIIYSSKEKLYRNVLVFNQDGREIKNCCDYSGTAVFCHKEEQPTLKTITSNRYYILSYLNVKKGDAVAFDNFVFNFSSMVKPGVFGDCYENVYVRKDTDDRVRLYKEVKYLIFENLRNRGENYEILVNGKRHKLSDFEYTISERGEYNKYEVKFHIDHAGFYSILVNEISNGKTNRIAKFDVAVDYYFCYEITKLDDYTFEYYITGDLSDYAIRGQLELDSFDEKTIKGAYYTEEYYYLIPFMIDAYRISGCGWQPYKQDIWGGDIKEDSVLELYDPEIDELIVYSDTGTVLETLAVENKGIISRIKVGFICSYKKEYDHLLLLFTKDGVKKHTIFCLNKCYMKDETEWYFDSDSGTMLINPWFEGKGNVYCEIHDSSDNKVFRSDSLKNNCTIEVEGILPEEKYAIVFYEKEKGLSLAKPREIKRYYQVFYTPENFVGKDFRIVEVNYDEEKVSIPEEKITKLSIHFESRDKEGNYHGEMYEQSPRPGYRCNIMKPIVAELCSDITSSSIEIFVTKNGIPLTIIPGTSHVTDSLKNKGRDVISFRAMLV